LTSSKEEIINLIESLEREAKALKEEALKFCWFMRGGLSYSESMMLSAHERKTIGKLVEENMETTKKSGLPFF
jgi:hypothetical protein